MSAPDFRGCGEFGIWAFEYGPDWEWYNEHYPSPEYTDADRERAAADDREIFEHDAVRSITPELEELNSTLDFYQLGLEGGYYSGVEIVLTKEPYSDDKESIAEIYEEMNNAYMPFWNYGDNVDKPKFQRKAYQKYLDEYRRIDRWLNTVAADCGFRPYGIAARFSNGETWYREGKLTDYSAPQENPNAYFFNQARKGKGKAFVPFLKRRK